MIEEEKGEELGYIKKKAHTRQSVLVQYGHDLYFIRKRQEHGFYEARGYKKKTSYSRKRKHL